LYRIEKDDEKAALYLERARSIRPASVALRYQLGSLELSRGNLPKATDLLEQVTREAPAFVEGHISLATAYYRQKRKADGDRERAIVDKLNAEVQAKDLKTR
jgi:predicted Zn-dependent protease